MSVPWGRNGTEAYALDFVDPAEIKPDPRNARTHPAKQIGQIERSITKNRWSNPILVDEAGVIIAGHARCLAARNLKLPAVPVIIIRGLTEAQKRSLRIADNKIALNSGWDLDLLGREIRELRAESPDLEIPGFEVGELDSMLLEPVDPEEEAIPPMAATAVSRSGDIWRIGSHRVICGDVREPSLLTQVVGGAKMDAAFLDPPYNVVVDGHAGGKGRTKHREFAMASGEMTPEEFAAFLGEALGACARVSRDGAVHFVCMDHHHVEELLQAGRAVYGKRLNICVWNKSNAGMGALYRSKHELVFVYRVGQAQHFNAVQLGKYGRNRTNVWDAASVNTFGGARSQDLELHPTVKPVGLVADAIMDVTRRGEAVLDAFLGSGTTLIACERTGRVCFGAEIDPPYVDVAIERFFRVTGQRGVLERTGETFKDVRDRRATEDRETGDE